MCAHATSALDVAPETRDRHTLPSVPSAPLPAAWRHGGRRRGARGRARGVGQQDAAAGACLLRRRRSACGERCSRGSALLRQLSPKGSTHEDGSIRQEFFKPKKARASAARAATAPQAATRTETFLAGSQQPNAADARCCERRLFSWRTVSGAMLSVTSCTRRVATYLCAALCHELNSRPLPPGAGEAGRGRLARHTRHAADRRARVRRLAARRARVPLLLTGRRAAALAAPLPCGALRHSGTRRRCESRRHGSWAANRWHATRAGRATAPPWRRSTPQTRPSATRLGAGSQECWWRTTTAPWPRRWRRANRRQRRGRGRGRWGRGRGGEREAESAAVSRSRGARDAHGGASCGARRAHALRAAGAPDRQTRQPTGGANHPKWQQLSSQ